MPSNQNPVYTDDTLKGDGTVEDPLSVAGGGGSAPAGADGDFQFKLDATHFGNSNDIFPGGTATLDPGSGTITIASAGSIFISSSSENLILAGSSLGINSGFANFNTTIGFNGTGSTLLQGSNIQAPNLPVFANNAAALLGGLIVGSLYRTGADPDPICVVH